MYCSTLFNASAARMVIDSTDAFIFKPFMVDLNGDGYEDMVWTSAVAITYYLHVNPPSGTFSAVAIIARIPNLDAATDAVHVRAGDADGDGDMDIFSASNATSQAGTNLVWYMNTCAQQQVCRCA